MDEAIDESDDAGGVGEDLVPLGEGFVGREHDWFFMVAAADDLEEEVSVMGAAREISQLVEDEDPGPFALRVCEKITDASDVNRAILDA